MTKKGECELQHRFNGICKSCMRRWRCPLAFKYSGLQVCNAYKVHKNSLIYKKEAEQSGNKTNERTV